MTRNGRAKLSEAQEARLEAHRQAEVERREYQSRRLVYERAWARDLESEWHPGQWPRWYAIYALSGEEALAETSLRRLGCWTAFAFERRVVYNRLRIRRTIVVPRIPNYLFAALRQGRDHSIDDVAQARGVHEIVHFGEAPFEIPHPAMELILERLEDDGFPPPPPGPCFAPGDAVQLSGESLWADFRFIVERVDDDGQISIWLPDANSGLHMRAPPEALEKL